MSNGISYQNKDIFSKWTAEYLKDKSFAAYGLDLPRIKEVLPTNLPVIEANELRLDNIFLLEDDSVAIIDYESTYDDPRQKIKYLNYVARILERFRRDSTEAKIIRMIVIYTADIERNSVDVFYQPGCVTLKIEPVFLSEIDSENIYKKIKSKIINNEKLDETEQMQFIIMPLSVKGKKEKNQMIMEEIRLTDKIKDEQLNRFLLSSLLVFSDKVIDRSLSNMLKRRIAMTKVGKLFEEEHKMAMEKKDEELKKKDEELIKKDEELIKKDEELIKKDEENALALKKKDEENALALKKKEEEKALALKKKDEENALVLEKKDIELKKKDIELKKKDEETALALKKKDEENALELKNMIKIFIQNVDMSDIEILQTVKSLTYQQLEDIRKEISSPV